jgi:hypothetical protein
METMKDRLDEILFYKLDVIKQRTKKLDSIIAIETTATKTLEDKNKKQ